MAGENVTPGVEASMINQPESGSVLSGADAVPDVGVWRWTIATGAVTWSPELEVIYGLAPGTFAGTLEAFTSYLHPDDAARVLDDARRTVETGQAFVCQERIMRPTGEVRNLVSHGQASIGADGIVSEVVGICHDVTDRMRVETALSQVEHRMREIIENTPSLICIRGADHRYTMVNGEYERLLGIAPEMLIGQTAGVAFPGLAAQCAANDDRAVATGTAVHDEMELDIRGERRLFHTVTFPLPRRGDTPPETCTISTDVTERRRVEEELRIRRDAIRLIGSALDDGRMIVAAQPVVHIRSGTHLKDELLVRLQPPSGGTLMPPDAFLPCAERYGLIQAIDAWMVTRALELARDRSVAVNVSAVTLCDDRARDHLLRTLSAEPRLAARITFELTETAAATHLPAAERFAAAVTELGANLSLDDFGTGFGSFTYLRRLPLRYLKIDRSFVTNLARSADDRRVVASIISIAEQYELRTIAEGVEDTDTLALLEEMGADYAQGYLIGCPERVVVNARQGRGAGTA